MVAGVLGGDRTVLARAITLIESTNPQHQADAQDLLIKLMPRAGHSVRIGVSGLPGAGKSTFIDAFGSMLTAKGHKVAVLAVDPSSSRAGGSILGDKTRMMRLAQDANAYIRPSPTGGTLGGVSRATREAIVVCEAAGFDVVLVETVGVGQSEVSVAAMVDFFLVLMLAGGGDDLQGIKKGVLEIADMIAITKADGDNMARARESAADYGHALRIVTPAGAPWVPPVVIISARENKGLDDVWGAIERFSAAAKSTGRWDTKRADQHVRWMWAMVEERVLAEFRSSPAVRSRAAELERAVASGSTTAALAAAALLNNKV
ncbi:MAG: methylmalonyl Co-A mutase-associated GTPase MeaB [Alphaproteobacteria bacterium]|nr:methylmalonyl Co-A mutase-associated GTPase MeaB [Alphaproteobacteria bacterium]